MASDPGTTPSDNVPPAVIPVYDSHLDIQQSNRSYWIGWIIFLVAYVSLFFMGDRARLFAFAGLQSLPFLVLAVLAYVGDRYPEKRILAFLYWLALMFIAGGGVFLTAAIAVVEPAGIDQLSHKTPDQPLPAFESLFIPGGPRNSSSLRWQCSAADC